MVFNVLINNLICACFETYSGTC